MAIKSLVKLSEIVGKNKNHTQNHTQDHTWKIEVG